MFNIFKIFKSKDPYKCEGEKTFSKIKSDKKQKVETLKKEKVFSKNVEKKINELNKPVVDKVNKINKQGDISFNYTTSKEKPKEDELENLFIHGGRIRIKADYYNENNLKLGGADIMCKALIWKFGVCSKINIGYSEFSEITEKYNLHTKIKNDISSFDKFMHWQFTSKI